MSCYTPGVWSNVADPACPLSTTAPAPGVVGPSSTLAPASPGVSWQDPRLDHPYFDWTYLVVAILIGVVIWALHSGAGEYWLRRVMKREPARQPDTKTDGPVPSTEEPQVNAPSPAPAHPPIMMAEHGDGQVMDGDGHGDGLPSVTMSAEEFDRRAARMQTLRWGPSAADPEPVSNFISLDVPSAYTEREERIRWMGQRLDDNWTPARIYAMGEVAHGVSRPTLERDLRAAKARRAAGGAS